MPDSTIIDLGFNDEELKILNLALQRIRQGEIFRQMDPLIINAVLDGERLMRQLVSGQVLNRQSGVLSAAIGHSPLTRGKGQRGRDAAGRFTAGAGNALLITFGVMPPSPAVKYADFLVRGGTIRPKNARQLAIPLPAARTAAGVPRYASPLRVTLPRSFPGGTFVQNSILYGKPTPNSAPVPLFVLKDSVRIDPRDFVTLPTQLVTKLIDEEAARLYANSIVIQKS